MLPKVDLSKLPVYTLQRFGTRDPQRVMSITTHQTAGLALAAFHDADKTHPGQRLEIWRQTGDLRPVLIDPMSIAAADTSEIHARNKRKSAADREALKRRRVTALLESARVSTEACQKAVDAFKAGCPMENAVASCHRAVKKYTAAKALSVSTGITRTKGRK